VVSWSTLGCAWWAVRHERPWLAERLAELWRERSFAPAPLTWRPPAPIGVLRVAATAPAPRLGGLQTQLLARLDAEARLHPVALGYPAAAGWRLEVDIGGQRRALVYPPITGGDIELEDPGFEANVTSAAATIGARALHLEGLAGMPPLSLLRLRRAGLRLVIGLHDFAAFCLRPHLLEQPLLTFCGYCRDPARCGRCLRSSWPVDDGFQARRRAAFSALLCEADALIFPSAFLRDAHRELFPDLPPARAHVIAPARVCARMPPRPPGPRALRHVAFVGGVQAHKGAAIFLEVLRLCAGCGLRWTAYGYGEACLVERVRAWPSVRVHGAYRRGMLPRLLRRDDVDLALILSVVPESYSLTLDECVLADVPVLALDAGALAERVAALGAGRLVRHQEGASGVARALRDIQRGGRVPEISPHAAPALPDSEAVASATVALYRELRL
jgi:hypothetical protein